MPTLTLPKAGIVLSGERSPLCWPDKAPGTIDDHTLDLSAWIGGTSVAAARVAVTVKPTSLALMSLSLTSDSVTLRLGGGEANSDQTLVWTILAGDGRRLDVATPLHVDATPAAAPVTVPSRPAVTCLPQSLGCAPPGALFANGTYIAVAPTASGSVYIDGTMIAVALGLASGDELPTSPDGLAPGAFWRNGSYINVVPQPAVESNLPTSPDGLASGSLWLNGNLICVA
ncbi:conserved protein of unknown function [Rhodovastum atsumiense]|uniref:Uncharacterized protein n=1 Tax=Rhodovastum atsumiense TaxID=504468 RepID=A0A5M6IYP5_9PROT|nr:hypothetical protein [Rhodovastum atsumiense]KAA5613466.1 hypothetical protein F1189_05260 [Rhodovastum atsumiense]CAH2603203.1 conserved protein of unknown function [Rhodovastum atsumiense]